MRLLLIVLFCLPLLAWGQQDASSTQSALSSLSWEHGPTEGRVGSKAVINVPKDFVFLDERNTRRFLELAGNPPRDGHYVLAPAALDWWSVFSFNSSGYVKDDEKIDPSDLLQTLKKSDGPSNEERKKLGMETIVTEGWEILPHYDSETRRLEWGLRLRSGNGATVVNYTSRLLGRTGVTSATLVSDPATLKDDVVSFKAALKGFDYVAGERYTEFKQGDKMAEYGLAALIVGGAAAVATKKGFWGVIAAFFAAFWKVIAGVAVAAVAGLGSLFGRKKNP